MKNRVNTGVFMNILRKYEKQNTELILNQGECWCEDGWGRLPGSSRCSQQSTQASCPAGQIVREAGRLLGLGLIYKDQYFSAHRCSKLDIHEALKGTEDEIEEKVNLKMIFDNS